MKARRLAIGIGGVALVLAALWFAVRRPAIGVDVGRVDRGPLVVTVDEEGRTRVRERYVVAAPVTGRLRRPELDEGDAVAAGEVVARVDPAPLDSRSHAQAAARLEAATAARREAEARAAERGAALTHAERERERAERLARAGTLSAQERERVDLAHTSRARELDAAREAADAAAHEIEVARAALREGIDEVRGDLPAVDVRTPAAGRVLRVLEESSRVVAMGTPILEIGDPAALEVVIEVLSADAVRVREGAAMELLAWGGRTPLQGRVRRVEPSAFTKRSALGVDEQRVRVIGELTGEGAPLGDGYRVEARIVVWEAASVARVPAAALFRRGDQWCVFAIEDGRARLRHVELGERGHDAVELRAGLADDTPVILHPDDRIADSTRVRGRR